MEKVITQQGEELAKITVVDEKLTIIYDSFVRPESAVLDYLTKYSGVTAKDLDQAEKTREQIIADLSQIISKETILVGHDFSFDLKAL